jgi:hypothetical protein
LCGLAVWSDTALALRTSYLVLELCSGAWAACLPRVRVGRSGKLAFAAPNGHIPMPGGSLVS